MATQHDEKMMAKEIDEKIPYFESSLGDINFTV